MLGNYLKSVLSSARFCNICGENENGRFMECSNKLCDGFFCYDCFEELNNECPKCNLNINYRNTGDDSLEEDSSDEEENLLLSNRSNNNNQNDNNNDTENEFDFEYQDNKTSVQIKDEKVQLASFHESEEEIKRRNAIRKKLVSEKILPKIQTEKNSTGSKRMALFKISRRKAKKIIKNELNEMYKILDENVKMCRLDSKADHAKICDLFLEDLFKTILDNIALNEFFDIEELNKNSFYDDLKLLGDEYLVFKIHVKRNDNPEYDPSSDASVSEYEE